MSSNITFKRPAYIGSGSGVLVPAILGSRSNVSNVDNEFERFAYVMEPEKPKKRVAKPIPLEAMDEGLI